MPTMLLAESRWVLYFRFTFKIATQVVAPLSRSGIYTCWVETTIMTSTKCWFMLGFGSVGVSKKDILLSFIF